MTLSGKHRQAKAVGTKRATSARGKGSRMVAVKVLKVGTDARGDRAGSSRVDVRAILHEPYSGVDRFAERIAGATPYEIVEIERSGVPGIFIKDLSRRMQISSTRIFKILGLPKATVEKKVATGKMIAGSGGQAAIGMAKLLALANEIVASSTATRSRGFDAAKWLGQWIERPQPSLGGRKPADLLDTPTGLEVVARVLGAAESGAYQ